MSIQINQIFLFKLPPFLCLGKQNNIFVDLQLRRKEREGTDAGPDQRAPMGDIPGDNVDK